MAIFVILHDRVVSLQSAIKQLNGVCAAQRSKSVDDVLSRAVQGSMRQSVVPSVDRMVEEMKGEVMRFVKEWNARNELDEIRESVMQMKEEMVRMKEMVESGAMSGVKRLTEKEVDAMIGNNMINQLLIRVSDEADQRIVMYTCMQLIDHGCLTEEVEAGLLMSLVYRVRVVFSFSRSRL